MLYLEMLAGRDQHIRETRRRAEHDRLEARLARAARSGGEGVPRRGRIARRAALVTALFGYPLSGAGRGERRSPLLPKFDYYLDESDPDVLVLRRRGGAVVAAFSAGGHQGGHRRGRQGGLPGPAPGARGPARPAERGAPKPKRLSMTLYPYTKNCRTGGTLARPGYRLFLRCCAVSLFP